MNMETVFAVFDTASNSGTSWICTDTARVFESILLNSFNIGTTFMKRNLIVQYYFASIQVKEKGNVCGGSCFLMDLERKKETKKKKRKANCAFGCVDKKRIDI